MGSGNNMLQVLILKGLCDWRMEECEEISSMLRSEAFAVTMVCDTVTRIATNTSTENDAHRNRF